MTAAPVSEPRAAPGADRPLTRRSISGVTIVVATAALLALGVPWLTVAATGSAPYEVIRTGFPGWDVALLTTTANVIADASATLTVGALATLLFVRARPRRAAAVIDEGIELTVLRAASATWSLSAAAMVGLELFDANGVAPGALTQGLTVESALGGGLSGIGYLFEASQHPQAWAVTFVAASVVTVASMFARRWTGLLIPAWAAGIGVLAPVVVGQILVGPQHDFGSDAGAAQTLAMATASGVIAVAAVRVATGRVIDPTALRRLSLCVGVATGLSVAADVVLALFKLQGAFASTSLTAVQIAARMPALLALFAVLLAAARRWRRGRLTDRSVAGLLAAATLASAWWLGWTVAMTRIPPPQYFVPTTIAQNFLGFDVDAAPTVLVLLTQWRPNLLFVALGIAGIGVYVWGVRALRRRGDPWPVGRTVAWIAGWIVAVVATSSGFGKYSAPDFGVHMIVHMSLNMLAPLLLVLGGFVTLMLRATATGGSRAAGVHEWLTQALQWPVLRFLYHPLLVFVLFVGSYYALYFSGLFETMVRYHWAHQVMNLHFLLVGYLYYGLAVGVDRPPRPLPHVGKLGFVLAAMPFHAFFGVILMTSSLLVAEDFYLYLRLPWADLPAAQYLAGGVAWAAGELPLMLVVIVLGIQWSRQDERQSRRTDRHLDAGLDDEFDEYNRMLARLSVRRPSLHPAPPASDGDAKEPAHDRD
ncbi:cytochrome c oxidase assembly protein [Microbacterium sp. RD1]|uniref:cytochrome c oxidase assembly protein n=1 Tax=Microbacterium sp. RD1 TaxID=3457313 RepID=UPI003FA60C99